MLRLNKKIICFIIFSIISNTALVFNGTALSFNSITSQKTDCAQHDTSDQSNDESENSTENSSDVDQDDALFSYATYQYFFSCSQFNHLNLPKLSLRSISPPHRPPAC